MFDPKKWRFAKNITVSQFCDYLLENVPGDALFYVCGDNYVYMHQEEDGSVFSVDNCSLSDLEEYDNYDVIELEDKINEKESND